MNLICLSLRSFVFTFVEFHGSNAIFIDNRYQFCVLCRYIFEDQKVHVQKKYIFGFGNVYIWSGRCSQRIIFKYLFDSIKVCLIPKCHAANHFFNEKTYLSFSTAHITSVHVQNDEYTLQTLAILNYRHCSTTYASYSACFTQLHC